MADEFALMTYKVVRVDGDGMTTTLSTATNLAEARERFRECKAALAKPGVRIKLIARPDPGWSVLIEE